MNCKLGTVQLQKPNLPSSTGPNQQGQTQADKDKDNVKIYTFDSVYDGTSEQAEIYADIFHPLVDSVLEGFNGTIFAYGQTGTGKTFTMEGSPEDPGALPRSFTHIFSHIGRSTDKQFLVRSSYLGKIPLFTVWPNSLNSILTFHRNLPREHPRPARKWRK